MRLRRQARRRATQPTPFSSAPPNRLLRRCQRMEAVSQRIIQNTPGSRSRRIWQFSYFHAPLLPCCPPQSQPSHPFGFQCVKPQWDELLLLNPRARHQRTLNFTSIFVARAPAFEIRNAALQAISPEAHGPRLPSPHLTPHHILQLLTCPRTLGMSRPLRQAGRWAAGAALWSRIEQITN